VAFSHPRDEHAARSRHDVCSPEAPQLAWAKAGPGATTDEGGGLVATLRRRLGIGEGEKQGDLTICVGGLGVLAGTPRRRRLMSGDIGGEMAQVRLQCAPCRWAQRRLEDEAFDESPGEHRVHLEADAEACRELANLGGREQQRLRPLFALRPDRGDDASRKGGDIVFEQARAPVRDGGPGFRTWADHRTVSIQYARAVVVDPP